MKDIKQYIMETRAPGPGRPIKIGSEIQFQGKYFQLNHLISSKSSYDLFLATNVKEFTDDMWKDLKKQGCQYFICIPPHYTKPGNEKVDEFQIKMFIKGKNMFNMYKTGEHYALYDVKTHECVNKEIMEKGKAYKVIRFE